MTINIHKAANGFGLVAFTKQAVTNNFALFKRSHCIASLYRTADTSPKMQMQCSSGYDYHVPLIIIHEVVDQ